MAKEFNLKIAAAAFRKRKQKRRWNRVVTALACVVVFSTTYALILPAITMTDTPCCGLEEHTHTDDCYAVNLTCTLEEGHVHTGDCYSPEECYTCGLEETEGHTHTDACYEEQSCYVCGLEETEGHIHSDACYTETTRCVCGLEESAGHSHSDSCYEERSILVCELEEDENHRHDASCYQTESVLICGQEESVGHTHTDACFETVRELSCGLEECEGHTHTEDCLGTMSVLVCGQEECEAHHHTDDCLGTQLVLTCGQEENHVHTDTCYGEPELICGLEEHTHTEECYSDPSADTETAADWESTLRDLELTGNWREDVLAVAESQLGYTESTNNYIVNEAGARKGYTRYGAWYGVPYGDWCAMFVSFCVRYAGVTEEALPIHSACEPWVTALEEAELYESADSGYIPQAGDIVFFDTDDDDLPNHVGLVYERIEATEAEPGKLVTIEGNNGPTVSYFEYELDSERLLGYGVLPENPELTASEEPAASEEPGQAEEQKLLTFAGEDYTITLRYTAAAQLPENVQLSVREILPGDEEYEAKRQEAESAVSEQDPTLSITGTRLFDITLLSDGVEIEPAAPVEVEVHYAESVENPENTEFTAVHFTDDGTEVIETEALEGENGIDGLTYSQNSFSTVAFVATQNGGECTFTGTDFTVTVTYTSDAFPGIAATNLSLDVTEVLPQNEAKTTGDANYSLYLENAKAALRGAKLGANQQLTIASGTRLFELKVMNGEEAVQPAAPVTVKVTYTTAVSLTELDADKTVDYSVVHLLSSGDETEVITPIAVTETVTEATATTAAVKNVSSYEYSQSSFSVVALMASQTQTVASSTPSAGAPNFKNTKTIDYLGDNATGSDKNPDTDVSGNDLYRLYLDISAESEPVDLVIVIDQSNSMTMNNCSLDGTSMTRKQALINFLAGYTSGSTTVKGFVDRFMEMNSDNKVSIVGYNSNIQAYSPWYSSGDDYNTFIKNLGSAQGTNYQAGLKAAHNRLSEMTGNNHRKMVIFLSDGAPTVYYTSSGSAVTDYKLANDSSYSGVINNGTYSETRASYKIFLEDHKDVTVYTIGMLRQNNESDAEGEAFLKEMADGGGGSYFGVYNDISNLMTELLGIFQPAGVTITDYLSDYVTYYSAQPDLLVTKTKIDDGIETVLYQSKSSSVAVQSPLQYVNHSLTTDSSGNKVESVTAKLLDSYRLESGYKYTLSFNVRSTQLSRDHYEYYASTTNDGYNNNTGGSGTDYTTSEAYETSSTKGGFNSNLFGTVSYTLSGVSYTEYDYAYPVVQANYSETAKSANYMILEKRFTGVTADKLTEDFKNGFSISVQSQDDATLSYTLTSANKSDDSTDLVWRWMLLGAGSGSYTVTETGAAIEDYDLTTTYAPAKADKTDTITVGTNAVTLSNQDFATDADAIDTLDKTMADGTILVLADANGTAVLSKSALSASMRANVEAALADNSPTTWKNFSYYTLSEEMACQGHPVKYASDTGLVTIVSADWTAAARMTYDPAEVTKNPEIVVTNAYAGSDVTLKILCEGPDGVSFPFTVTATKDGTPITLDAADSSFDLKNGDTAKEISLPVGATVTVEESGNDGYYVFVTKDTDPQQAGDTYTVSGMAANVTLTFFNNPGVELPHTGGTGGSGALWIGSGIMLLAILWLALLRIKKPILSGGQTETEINNKNKQKRGTTTMKRLFALLLACLMLLCIAPTALAADDYKIYVENATIGQQYSIYKIFDSTHDADDTSKVAYTYVTADPDTDEVYQALTAANSIFNVTKTTIANTYNVTLKSDTTTGSEIVDFLKVNVVPKLNPVAGPVTATSDKVIFDVTAYGYGFYYVTSTLGAAVTLDSTNPYASVIDKNQAPAWDPKNYKNPGEDEVETGKFVSNNFNTGFGKTSTAAIGDTVYYMINAFTPRFIGDQAAASYTFTDTLPLGLTCDESSVEAYWSAKLNTTEYSDWTKLSEALCTVTITPATATTGQVVTVTLTPSTDGAVSNFLRYAECHVSLRFQADVNKDAVYDNQNTVSLTWTRADGSTGPDTAMTSTTDTYVLGFNLQKVDQDLADLSGAKFLLYDAETEGNVIPVVKTAEGQYRVAVDGEEGVEIEAGTAQIFGLDAKTYYLNETYAPRGYNVLEERVAVTLANNTTVDANADGIMDATVQVVNQAGRELPSTGGTGTMTFFAVGGTILALAVVLLITKKRMSVAG